MYGQRPGTMSVERQGLQGRLTDESHRCGLPGGCGNLVLPERSRRVCSGSGVVGHGVERPVVWLPAPAGRTATGKRDVPASHLFSSEVFCKLSRLVLFTTESIMLCSLPTSFSECPLPPTECKDFV